MNIMDFSAFIPENARCAAAAVSGGPDSMAMLSMLSRSASVPIYAYTVDHGLRDGSAEEARQVGEWVKGWPNVKHRILTWEGEKPQSRIMEGARRARYALLEKAMREDGAQVLFIAHHQDDQAETFLTRLAKGSGLDGLSGMAPVQRLESGIVLARPFLESSKEELVSFCTENGIPYVTDPSNQNDAYLRPRLRTVSRALAEEGLSAKRLAVTAKRIARARAALEDLTEKLFSEACRARSENAFSFDFNLLRQYPEEIVLRILLKAMDILGPEKDYGPRLERVEILMERILKEAGFRGATLGGCFFSLEGNDNLLIEKEK
jgi:tRNA(Ile)-lysidine synthase